MCTLLTSSPAPMALKMFLKAVLVANYVFGSVLCEKLTRLEESLINNGTKDYSCAELGNEHDCLNIPPFYGDNDIFSKALGFNYTCMWNGTDCTRLICSSIDNSTECSKYSSEDYNYICDWSSSSSSNGISDNSSMCYNNCPKKYQVVLAIDTSSSVIDPNQGGHEDNRMYELNTVVNILSFVWSLAGLQNGDNDDNINNTENVLFSLITYHSDVTVHFDFDNHNNFTSLDDYISRITDIFNSVDYNDDSATAAAMEEGYNIFNDFNSNSIINNASNINSSDYYDYDNEWTKIFGVITVGPPNVPATASSPCDSIYGFNKRFSNLGILFDTLLVGFDQSEAFECLTQAPLFGSIQYAQSFDDIGNDIIGLLFDSYVCNINGKDIYDDDDKKKKER